MAKITPVISLSLLIVFLLLGIGATNKSSWQLAKEKDAIKVFTRPSSLGNLKDSKGVVQVKASVDDVVELLRKFDGYTKWMYKCSESKLLKQVSETEYYVYTVTDAPWPVSDRDLISKVIAEKKADGTVSFKLTGVKDFIPEKSDKVRVPRFSGLWQASPKPNGMVEIIYQLESDPGGSLPDWLANSTATDIPYYTLLEMKKLLAK
ncbi:MAG: START domain-containing protein [Sphingobacteriales bacterium]|nr:MAG: START domain-containing protein [Sphingobacteriales bacterium]